MFSTRWRSRGHTALTKEKLKLKFMRIAELRPYQEQTVVLRLHDGEIATVRVVFVDAEHDDIVVEIVHTNRPGQYKGPPNSWYTIRPADIASVDNISN
jgi:hypothetical protein